MKSEICVQSILDDLNPGDHIFSADFVSDPEGDRLEIKEFEFVKYVTGKNTSDIEVNSVGAVPAIIFDVRFPKIQATTDISHGFFKSGKEAAEAFMDMITHIYETVKESYQKFVNLN